VPIRTARCAAGLRRDLHES